MHYYYMNLCGVRYRCIMITCNAMQIQCSFSCSVSNSQPLNHWLRHHSVMNDDTTRNSKIKGNERKNLSHPRYDGEMYVTIGHCVIKLHYMCTSFRVMTAVHQCQLPLCYCRLKFSPKVEMLGEIGKNRCSE